MTYDEEKVTYDENTGYVYERPIIELRKENNTLVLRWNRITLDTREYRVVISKAIILPNTHKTAISTALRQEQDIRHHRQL